jgi:hypothetical protein
VIGREHGADAEYSTPPQAAAGLGASTVGLTVVGRAPMGCMTRVSFSPTAGSPCARTMNGFHSGYAGRSASTVHTAAAGASMSIEARSSVLIQTIS